MGEVSIASSKNAPGGNNVNTNINSTAWGISKTSQDYSIFHAMWNYDVNGSIWIGRENGTEVDLTTSTKITSVNGTCQIQSGATNGDYSDIRSFRSPRYQPNRGHIYSTSVLCPDYDTSGATRRWGLGVLNNGDIETGVYFELRDGVLYGIVRSGDTTKSETDLTSGLANQGITLSDIEDEGLLFDIQFQWRGVGNYFFYVQQKLVGTIDISAGGYVTMENPQLPAILQSKNITAGANVILRCGCIDISSEGGEPGKLTDASFANDGLVTIPGGSLTRTPLAIFRVNSTYKSKINTRNFRLLRITSSALTRNMKIGFAITRDATAITQNDGVYNPVNDYSSLDVIDQSLSVTTPASVDFSKTHIAYKATVPASETWEANEPNRDLDFYLTGGDYIIIFARQVKTGTDGEADCTVEFGEEI